MAILIKNLGFLGYSNYSVDNQGNVFSEKIWRGNKRGKLSATFNNKYLIVKMINDNGQRKAEYVSRLVAKAFVDGETKEKKEIDHINQKRDDNRALNLRWVTREENMNNINSQKCVWSFHPKTGKSNFYKSVAEAQKETGINAKNIFSALYRKHTKTASGLYWIFAEKNN
jgi:hypothetical protein